jgi:hypothetical protein
LPLLPDRAMKRVPTLPRIAAALLLALSILSAQPAAAQSIGGSCSPNPNGTVSAPNSLGQILVCVSGTWALTPAFAGNDATACSSTNAGEIRWTGSAFQGCNGSAWGTLASSGSAALSALTSSTVADTFDNVAWAQIWTWNSLTTGTALTLSSSSMTSGQMLALSNTNTASSTGSVLSVSNSEVGASYGINASSASTGAGTAVYGSETGAANTGFGVVGTNSSTGAGTGLYGAETGASNTGYGVQAVNNSATGWGVYASGTSPNYFAGNVGIGTTSPNTALDANGDITDRSVTSCSTLGTNSSGKLICEGSLPLTYISTQTASASASLQFTNLPTSYNTLFLNCTGLVASSTSAYIVYQVGEGATPTWETGAHYSGFIASNFGESELSTLSGQIDLTGLGGGGGFSLSGTTSYPETMQLYIPTPSSSSAYKQTTWSATGYNTPNSTYAEDEGDGFWSSDTQPITALQVTTTNHAGATITSGSCSLYGLNNSGGGNAAISGLTGATATDTFDNVAWAQIWTWNSLTTGTALTLSSSSMTSGQMLALSNTNTASSTGSVLSVSNSEGGASYGINASSASTGAGYGVYGSITGSGNSGYAVYGANTDTTGTNANYGVYATVANANNASVAVLGYDTATTGNGVGVEGFTGSSGAARGVYGTETGTGNTGYGVEGVNTSTTGANYGVYGTAASTGAAYGVYGSETGSGNTGYGGYFANTSTTGANYGVYATTSSTNASAYSLYCAGSGQCGGHAAWNNTSDARLKENVTDLAADRGLETLMKLRPVTFNWIDKTQDQRRHLGFIAQEVEPLYPETVGSSPSGMKTLAYSDLIVPLVKAVQQLKADNDNLKAANDNFRVEMQKQQVEMEQLQADIAALKAIPAKN